MKAKDEDDNINSLERLPIETPFVFITHPPGIPRPLLQLSPHHYNYHQGLPFLCLSFDCKNPFLDASLSVTIRPRTTSRIKISILFLSNYAAVSDQIDGISRDPPRVAQPKGPNSLLAIRTSQPWLNSAPYRLDPKTATLQVIHWISLFSIKLEIN